MKGVRIVGDRQVEVVDLPRPQVGTGEVLLRTTTSAVCGSDLHHYRADPAEVGHRAERVAGHEAVGVVEEVGDGVAGLSVGARVVAYQHHGCGRCVHCRTGHPMYCADRQTLGNHVDGSDAELVALPATSCMELPDEIGDPVGMLISCNLGTAWSGVEKLGSAADDVIVVTGLGPVGCCAVAAAADGARVVAVDPVASRRELAAQLGAAVTVDPTVTDVAEVARELSGGRGADGAIDCSGDHRALSSAFAALRPRGRMVVLAGTSTWDLDPQELWRRGVTIAGSWVYATWEFDGIVRFARRRADVLEQIVTRRFAATEVEAAFRAADGGREGKILIDWS